MRFGEKFTDVGQAHFPAGEARAVALVSRAEVLATMHGPECTCGTREAAKAISRSARRRLGASRHRMGRRGARGIRPFERLISTIEVGSYEIARRMHVPNSATIEAVGSTVVVVFTFRPSRDRAVQTSRIIPAHALNSTRLLAKEIGGAIGEAVNTIDPKDVAPGVISEWTAH